MNSMDGAGENGAGMNSMDGAGGTGAGGTDKERKSKKTKKAYIFLLRWHF
jgi:hypothetical protein